MFAQVFFLILFACCSLLSGCATKQAAQTDSTSIIREPESSHEVYGEVGAMYGASAR
jgi:hypothetical protein